MARPLAVRPFNAFLTLVVILISTPLFASDACDRCDLQALWDEYLSASRSSAAKAEEAAKLLGDAAGKYQEALDAATELGKGLVLPPDPFDPLSWCGQIGDVVGKFNDAMSVLGAFGNLWEGSANEAKAKELMESSAWYWREAQRVYACWKKCKDAVCQAGPAIVTKNPSVDFRQERIEERVIHECLRKLSTDQLRATRAAADGGRLAHWMRPEYIAVVQRLVSREGTLSH